jgi:hypothetical protein
MLSLVIIVWKSKERKPPKEKKNQILIKIMAGQLALTMDATASSAEDKYLLSKMPTIDYFQSVVKKSAPEVVYSTEMEVTASRFGPGETFTARLAPMGHFLRRVWLDMYVDVTVLYDPEQQEQQATPDSGVSMDRLCLLAYRLIESITLTLSHQRIQVLTSDWMCMWYELTLGQCEKQAWMRMASGLDVWQADTDAQRLILSIPIPFFFTDPDQFFPLFLLQASDVDAFRIDIQWANLDPLTQQPFPIFLSNARLYAEYNHVALSSPLPSVHHVHLERPIALVNTMTATILPNTSSLSIDLSPLGITLYRAIGALYFTINSPPPQPPIPGFQFSFAGGYSPCCTEYGIAVAGETLAGIYRQDDVDLLNETLENAGGLMFTSNRVTSARIAVLHHKNQPLMAVEALSGQVLCDVFPLECHESRATSRGLCNIHMIPFDAEGIEDSVQFSGYTSLPSMSLQLEVTPMPVAREVRIFMRYTQVLTFASGRCFLHAAEEKDEEEKGHRGRRERRESYKDKAREQNK